MAVWVSSVFALLLIPEHIVEAIAIAFVTSLLVTPMVSNQLARNLVRLLGEQKELIYRANHDCMTGLMNRSYFFAKLDEMMTDCNERNEPIGIVATDLDNFKAINDTYGHARGDAVIAGFANLMIDLAPDDAIIGRLGGEEFLIALPGDVERVETFVRCLCDTTSKLNLAETGATVSVGYVVDEKSDYSELCFRADAALYRAKRSGRNRSIRAA